MEWSGYQGLRSVLGRVQTSQGGWWGSLVIATFMWASGLGAASAEVSDQSVDTSEQRIEQWVAQVNDHWSTQLRSHTSASVRGFHIPLGAMKKIRGVWRLESSEVVSGSRRRLTWQVEGEPVLELFSRLAATIGESSTLQWQCDGRACGNGAEWANKVYQERLLYGRDEFMGYRAFQLPGGTWVTLFSAARTADRQYLHIDIIQPGIE